jgi:hypothetical protein
MHVACLQSKLPTIFRIEEYHGVRALLDLLYYNDAYVREIASSNMTFLANNHMDHH